MFGKRNANYSRSMYGNKENESVNDCLKIKNTSSGFTKPLPLRPKIGSTFSYSNKKKRDSILEIPPPLASKSWKKVESPSKTKQKIEKETTVQQNSKELEKNAKFFSRKSKNSNLKRNK